MLSRRVIGFKSQQQQKIIFILNWGAFIDYKFT